MVIIIIIIIITIIMVIIIIIMVIIIIIIMIVVMIIKIITVIVIDVDSYTGQSAFVVTSRHHPSLNQRCGTNIVILFINNNKVQIYTRTQDSSRNPE